MVEVACSVTVEPAIEPPKVICSPRTLPAGICGVPDAMMTVSPALGDNVGCPVGGREPVAYGASQSRSEWPSMPSLKIRRSPVF